MDLTLNLENAALFSTAVHNTYRFGSETSLQSSVPCGVMLRVVLIIRLCVSVLNFTAALFSNHGVNTDVLQLFEIFLLCHLYHEN